MEEEDYIKLQDLLIKLRVHLLKEISDNNLKPKYRDTDIKMIRSIDNLRKNAPIRISQPILSVTREVEFRDEM